MRLTPVAVAVLILTVSGCATMGESSPSFSQAGKGAAGAVAGGVIGNQIGNGRGKTAATAAGAAVGVVVASGCKVGVGTAVGGLFGGLFGSQVGGGNGKNAMAGLGASIGALLGSDCSPGANLSAPTTLANSSPIVMNGLTLTPITGFSPEAFKGIAPIVIPEDVSAASKAVKLFADDAKSSMASGNTERALLSMYWAKRIGTTTIGILNASLQSIATNKGGTVNVPSKALIILPAFNEPRAVDTITAAFDELNQQMAADQFPQRSMQVADLSGFNSALNFLRAPAAKQTVSAPNKASVMTQLAGLPENVVLRMADGTQIMKSQGALTVYNPNEAAITLPLEKLDFIPRTPEMTESRKQAAELMFKMREGQMKWAFGEYAATSGGDFDTVIQRPNRIMDLARGRKEVAYFTATGEIQRSPTSGSAAYQNNARYKRAVDTLETIDKTGSIRTHANTCMSSRHSHYTALGGMYANQLQAVCFEGNYSAPRPISVKSFYIGEGSEIVQTMESLMKDKAIQKTMNEALATGKSATDLLSFAPGLGSVEGALQCAGTYTLGQYQAAAYALGGTGAVKQSIFNSSRAFDVAKLSGWTPPDPQEWDMDRVASCVGTIPMASTATSALKGATKVASALRGKEILSGLGGRLDTLNRVTSAFESPTSIRQYVEGVKNVQDLVPGNIGASRVVKTAYDTMMTGQSLSSTYEGMKATMFSNF